MFLNDGVKFKKYYTTMEVRMMLRIVFLLISILL